MNFDPNNSFMVMVVLVFVAVLLLLEGLYMIWKSQHGPEAKKLNKRLLALSATRDGTSQTRLLRQRMLSELPAVERVLARIPRLHTLDRMILQAGLDWTVSRLLVLCAFVAIVGWMAASAFILDPWLSTVLVAAGAALPLVYVGWRRGARIGLIQKQLPDALDLITRALRAGHAFTSALKMTGEEMSEPIAGEFRTVHDEVNFGVSLQQALGHLSDRVPLTDLRYFVVAVLIQRESGGNLTEILGNLSRLIRERLKLFAKVKVLSSEGRLSAWVLGLMPFALAGLMSVFNPEFMTPLWRDPIGIAIVQYMLGLMAAGVVILVKIVKIRV
jgi:tight adherence protein B